MLQFDPQDPYPLLPEGSHTYADAQAHSAQVDAWLGMQTEHIENKLVGSDLREKSSSIPRQELWVGLPVKSMLTPYTEIRAILEELQLAPKSTVVDLGAGYGRMAFVIGRHFENAKFIGYEIVKERVEECRRCLIPFNYKNVSIEQADLASETFKPAMADAYFLYDYGSRAAIDKTLDDLREISEDRAIAVVGRGRASRDAIERNNPWLSEVIPPKHFSHYSIYRSAIVV